MRSLFRASLNPSSLINDKYFAKVYYAKATEAQETTAEPIEEFLENA
jgi:hypothetical protein